MELDENLVLNLKGKGYEISFPNVGQYRSIEVMKQTLSLSTYSGMSRALMATSEEALDMIDVEAHFSVLCPKMIEDLKCESFSQLGLLDYKEIRDLFRNEFVPWWNEIEKLLRPEPLKEVKKDEEAQQD